MSLATAPIGIYDSGLGGLSVLRRLQQLLPQESFVYLADTQRVPYGGRSEAEIRHFSEEIIHFLLEHNVKAILCACNTSSVVILPEMKRYRGVRVLGLAQAGARSPQGYRRVALLATEATVRSGLYSRLIGMRFPEVELLELACPEFVPLVETGLWSGTEVESVIARRLAPVLDFQPEAVILGCSHYPYLAPVLQKTVGPEVVLLDPAEHMVQQLERWLEREQLHNAYAHGQSQLFYATGTHQGFKILAEAYLQRELSIVDGVDLVHWPRPDCALPGL